MSYDDKRRGGRGRGERRGGREGGWEEPGGFTDFSGGGFDRPFGGGAGGRFGGGPGGAPGGGGAGSRFGPPRGPRGPVIETVVGQATGQVKFFNREKGFGFIVREDGGEDVFLHISAVEAAGLDDIAEGQPLEFALTDRNGRVSATELKLTGDPIAVPQRAPRPPREGGFSDRGGFGERRPRTPQTDGVRYEGTVKFFNGIKGFGFIARDDGGADAFVHISAVERAGLAGLEPNQRVTFELELDRRGKQAAVNIQLPG
jgi:CspA family cold shock protein